MTLTYVSIDQLLTSLTDRGRSQNTVKAYKADLLGFLEWADDSISDDQFESRASAYLNANRRVWKPKTTGRKLTALRSYAKWAGMPDALSDYTAPTPARPTPHPIPDGIEGVCRMADVAENARQQALVSFCGLAGLRVAEALDATPAWIDAAAMTLTVWGKGDRQRTIPLSVKAWLRLAPAVGEAIVQPRERIVSYSDRAAREAITRLGKKAGLSRNISSHDLRATFATAAYDKSKDLRAVQELLGHGSSKTTELYTGVSMENMRGAADL
jgi:site-specific recombinase XerD